jgi:multimeric flavodoxin WrbA
MRITVLNGSPKGKLSVTMQYVRYVQQTFPQHDLDIVHVAQRIKKIERDGRTSQDIVERIRTSDGVLWSFPLYILHVHGSYKRFIELIWEREAVDAFAGKHAASLSTSIHFFDHTAHNYIHAICDDLGMRFTGSFSAEMRDLLEEEGRAKLTVFAEDFFRAVEQDCPVQRRYPPLTVRAFDYTPGPVERQIDMGGNRVVVLTDAELHQTNLLRMVERFEAALSGDVEVLNLHDMDVQGGCLGCLKCGYDNVCAYQGKDGYVDFYDTKLRTADILVFAGAIRDRYLSSTWKTFFDRSFFNCHTPALIGKQFGFIVSGPLAQIPTLREILEAWVQFQQSNVVGFVTDEGSVSAGDDSAHIDALLQNLAQRMVWFSDQDYVQPQTFLGVGGTKVFRDDIWGRLRIVFQADHRAYKQLGFYDFPQRDLGVRALNAVVSPLLRIPRVREMFTRRIKEGMVGPYQKLFESSDGDAPG